MSTEEQKKDQAAEQEQLDKELENQQEAEPAAEESADKGSELEAMAAELAKARDEQLRVHAEMQNLRRRTERDVANAHKYALEKFVGELLPVVDNLERAIAAHDGDDEGLNLTLKGFIDVLTRFKVEVVDPAGEPFDPELHQAMSMVPNPEMEDNSVMEVFQKGYTLNGRLVRPAMVVVVKN